MKIKAEIYISVIINTSAHELLLTAEQWRWQQQRSLTSTTLQQQQNTNTQFSLLFIFQCTNQLYFTL